MHYRFPTTPGVWHDDNFLDVLLLHFLEAKILKKFHLDGDDFKTVLLVMPDGRFFTKMDVVIEIVRLFGGVWKVFYALKIIPRPLRDSLYDFIAQRRYRIFGKSAYCALIPDRYKDRIIR